MKANDAILKERNISDARPQGCRASDRGGYMELLQLKYFCDAAHTENFSATAKKFGVPTSAVSQSISRLEKELGSIFFSTTLGEAFAGVGGVFFTLISSTGFSIAFG